MRARRTLVAGAALFAASVPVAAVTLGDRTPTPAEEHRLDEAREERLMLAAPPDAGRSFVEPPFESRNEDGRDGAGGRAVAYRTGSRLVSTPEAVAAAPEARLWRTGFGSWEPSLGLNRRGTIFVSARNSNADPGVGISDDGGRTWRRSKPPEHGASLDPFVWVDEATGRIFASDIDPPVSCTPFSRSDDEGKTWRYSRACGVTDHQNHFGGPPPPDGEKPTGYRNVIYYCAISGGALSGTSTFTGCLKSMDGGIAFAPTGDPAYPPKRDDEEVFCDGAAGHGIVDRAGTVYVPRGWCGPPTIAISRDEGATWTRRQVSDKIMGDSVHETSVAADTAGNLYYTWADKDHRPYLAISRDGGNTWGEERDLMPPGVANVSAFGVHVDAGAEGRIAFVFMGTGDAKPNQRSVWSAYMGSSSDALVEDPLFYAAPVNDPQTNALWRGQCGDLRCGNIGDFLDVEIGPDGSAWSALVDSCPGKDDKCITDLTITTPRGEGVVGQLAGGAPLVDSPRPPAGTERRCTPSKAPRTSYRRGRASFATNRRIAFRGRALERGCGEGIRRVEVAVARRSRKGTPSAGTRARRRVTCRFANSRGRLGRSVSCERRRYIAARGTDSWTFRLRRALPRGHYKVWARSVTRSGFVESVSRRNVRTFVVR